MPANAKLAPGEMFVYDDDFTDPWEKCKTAVLLQHGFVRNGKLWQGWVPHFGRKFRVLRPDFPGLGRSPDPGPGYAFSTEELVRQTLRVLDEREIERVHHVGEGVGAAVGAAIAGSHPDRIASLTLISEPVRVGKDIQANHSAGFPTWQQAIETLCMRGWWCRAHSGEHSAARDFVGVPEIDNYIADEIGSVRPHIALALARWAPTWDLTVLLPKVSAPCLFIWAEKAHWFSQELSAELVGLARNGRYLGFPEIETALLEYIYPDLVAPVVAKFVDEQEGA